MDLCITGAMGLIWYGFWMWLSFEKPRTHPTIDPAELEYIEEGMGINTQTQPKNIPWKEIFTSKPVYAIIMANFAYSWSYYLVIVLLPFHLTQKFHVDAYDTGILSSLPFICLVVIIPVGGQLADHLINTKAMTTTRCRKAFTCGGELYFKRNSSGYNSGNRSGSRWSAPAGRGIRRRS